MLDNLGHNLTQPHKAMCMHNVLTLRDGRKKNNHTNELQPGRDGLPQAAGAGGERKQQVTVDVL